MNMTRFKQVVKYIQMSGATHSTAGIAEILAKYPKGYPKGCPTTNDKAIHWLELTAHEARYLFRRRRTLKDLETIVIKGTIYHVDNRDTDGYDADGYDIQNRQFDHPDAT